MSEDPPRNNSTDSDPTTSKVFEAVQAIDTDTVTATDVAIVIGCSEQATAHRLDELVDRGLLEKGLNGKQVIWRCVFATSREERGVAERYEPVDGPETNAVELIETDNADE